MAEQDDEGEELALQGSRAGRDPKPVNDLQGRRLLANSKASGEIEDISLVNNLVTTYTSQYLRVPKMLD